MKPKSLPSKFWVRFGVSVFLYWSILWCAYYYFYRVPASAEPESFYTELAHVNYNFTEQAIRSVLFRGAGTQFERMVVRATFMRYKLDASPNGIFSKLIESFQDGIWNVPNEKVWRTVFAQFQDNWNVEQRKHNVSGQSRVAPKLMRNDQSQVVLAFDSLATSMIGTKLDFIVAVPDDTALDTPAQVVCVFDGEVQPLEMVAKWDLEPRIVNQRRIGLLHLDFSLQYEWFVPFRKLRSILINGTDVGRWDVLAVRSSDSKSTEAKF